MYYCKCYDISIYYGFRTAINKIQHNQEECHGCRRSFGSSSAQNEFPEKSKRMKSLQKEGDSVWNKICETLYLSMLQKQTAPTEKNEHNAF